jgi:hypothetical protein
MSTKSKTLIAFLIMLALVGGVVSWMLVLNTGKVAIHARVPFTVQAGNLYQQCNEDPCVISMRAYEYKFRVEKAGYFPYQETATLKRWKTVDLYPELKFIPYIEEKSLSPDDFAGDETQDSRNITKKGGKFILMQGEEETEIPFEGNVLTYSWGSDDNLLYVEQDEDTQKLFKWNLTDTPTLITQFQSLTEPIIEGGQKHILVLENEKTYKVDTEKKRKELIFDKEIAGIEWNPSGTAALLETKLEGLPLLILFHDEDGSAVRLPIQSSLARTEWRNDDEILFITFQELNDDLRASFANIGLDADEIAGTEKEVLQDHLMQYNYRTNNFEDLIILNLKRYDLQKMAQNFRALHKRT